MMLRDVNLEDVVLVNPKYIVDEITDSERGHFIANVYEKSVVSIFVKKVGPAVREPFGPFRISHYFNYKYVFD